MRTKPWKDPKHQWSWFTHDILDRGLSPFDLGVVMHVLRYTNGDRQCRISEDTLRKNMGVSLHTVRRAILRIETAGVFTVQRENGRANRYQFLDVPVPKKNQAQKSTGYDSGPTTRRTSAPTTRPKSDTRPKNDPGKPGPNPTETRPTSAPLSTGIELRSSSVRDSKPAASASAPSARMHPRAWKVEFVLDSFDPSEKNEVRDVLKRVGMLRDNKILKAVIVPYLEKIKICVFDKQNFRAFIVHCKEDFPGMLDDWNSQGNQTSYVGADGIRYHEQVEHFIPV